MLHTRVLVLTSALVLATTARAETDPIRYPEFTRELAVGDVFRKCVCGCVLVYEWEWLLKPCDEHKWKVRYS